MKTTIALPPLQLRAEVRPRSVDLESRTVDLAFSTGAPVQRVDGATGQRYLATLSLKPGDVRLGRLNNGAPVLNAHSAESLHDVIGVVVDNSARLEHGEGRARVRLSRRPAVEPIWQDVVAGILRNVSVGYRVHKYEQAEGAGTITRHAVDWEPYEVSLVPIGADAGAQVRALRALGARALSPSPVALVAGPDDPRPAPAELRALHEALAMDARVGGPLPPRSATLRWGEFVERASGEVLGGMTFRMARPPHHVVIAVGLGFEQTLKTVCHEMAHVRDGRGEAGADVYADLCYEVWRLESRERMDPATPRAVAGR